MLNTIVHVSMELKLAVHVYIYKQIDICSM